MSEITSEVQKFGNVPYLQELLKGAVADGDTASAANIRAKLVELGADPDNVQAPEDDPSIESAEPAAVTVVADEVSEGGGSSSPPPPALLEPPSQTGTVAHVHDLRTVLPAKLADTLRSQNIVTTLHLRQFVAGKNPVEALTGIHGFGHKRAMEIVNGLAAVGVSLT